MSGSSEANPGIISSLYRGDTQGLRVPRGPEDGQTVLVDVLRIKSCRYQRRIITPERARQLAISIKQAGLLQNPTIRPISGDPDYDYELIAGERRKEAFRLLLAEATTPEERERWSRLPCTLKLGLTEAQVAALAAVENLERDDGDPLEQALSLLEVKKAGAFQANRQVADATGLSLQKITRLLRLAEAPEVIQKAVTPGVYVEVTDKEGTTRHRHIKLDLSVVLALGPYFRCQEGALGRTEAIAKTERLLQRVAKGNWPRTRIEAEVKRLLGPRLGTELETDDEAAPEADELVAPSSQQAANHKQLFRDKGNQFIIYPRNLGDAAAADKKALLERLTELLALLKENLPHPSSNTAP